jgi:adenylyl cyclase-associated protein
MGDAALANLLGRLEQVASRLESVERQLASGGGGSAPAAAAPASAGAAESGHKSIAEFDDLVRQYFDKYVELSASIAPLVKQQADLVKEAVTHHRNVLNIAAQCKKPSNDVFIKLLKPSTDVVVKIVELRDKNRASPYFNHLSTLSEGVPAFAWVGISPTPGPHVDESRASSEFYSNKILMQYRHDQSEQGKTNVAWVSAWNTFLKELRQWIKTYHTTGLTWGGSADAASFNPSSAPAAAPASAGGAPPPPGPPPPMALDMTAVASGGGDKSGAAAALFAEINAVRDRQKSGKTEGLRHVTKEMKTKNQDRSAGPVATPKASAAAAKKAAPAAVQRPPKLALEGNKWIVEFQVGNRDIVISDVEPKHTVYIYKCENSVVQVKGKVNAITVDTCKKTGIVFDNAISSVEVVNCNGVQVQITGKVPSIMVDKSSGAQLFLSNECLDVEIVTSKSDEMNVVLPGKTASDDIEEIAVPEQFKTVIKNRKLVTEAVAHV